MRWKLGATGIAAAALVATSLIALPVADARAASTSTLPWSHYSHVVADGHGHVFVTGGSGTNGIWVRNADGSANTTILGQPGASGMTLSPDGSSLYVGLADGSAVSIIDTTDLQQRGLVPTPGACPDSVAVVGSVLWFSTECDGQFGSLGRADLQTLTVAKTTKQFYKPLLLAVPDDPAGLIVAERGVSPASVTRFTTSGTDLTVAASHSGGNEANLGAMALDPDGLHLVLACGAPYHHVRLRLSDLSLDGSYSSNTYPNSVATSTAQGGLVAAGVNGIYWDDIYLFAGGAPVGSLELGGEQLASDGLAWAPDGNHLYAVTAFSGSSGFHLRVFDAPTKAPSSVTITSLSSIGRTKPVRLSGILSTSGIALTGASLTITREDGSGRHAVGTATSEVTPVRRTPQSVSFGS